jgi:hypothetical protein
LNANSKFQMMTFFENLPRHKNLEKKAWGNSYDYRLNQYATFDDLHGLSLDNSVAQSKRGERRLLPNRYSFERARNPNLYSLHKVSTDIIKHKRVEKMSKVQNWTVTADVLVRVWNSRTLFTIVERDKIGRRQFALLL